jgi:hypothetical protein
MSEIFAVIRVTFEKSEDLPLAPRQVTRCGPVSVCSTNTFCPLKALHFAGGLAEVATAKLQPLNPETGHRSRFSRSLTTALKMFRYFPRVMIAAFPPQLSYSARYETLLETSCQQTHGLNLPPWQYLILFVLCATAALEVRSRTKRANATIRIKDMANE